MFCGQITRRGFRPPSEDSASRLAGQFARSHHVNVGPFVDADLGERWAQLIESAPFRPRVHHDREYWGGEDPPADLVLDAPDVVGRLLFSMNDRRLFRFVERLSGCAPIAAFAGVVYRMAAGMGHSDRWHTDLTGDRLIAVSVNLSRQAYAGGRLQLADSRTGARFLDGANLGFGHATIFRLAEGLEHRVSPMEPGPARTVLAGWFLGSVAADA